MATWIAGLPRRLFETYRRGALLPIAAPAIFALVVVPEFAQHVVEISLGMFVSKADFIAHAPNGLRMGFGVAKICGLILCMLMTARFWWCGGSFRTALAIRPADLGRIMLGIGLIVLASLPAEWAARSHIESLVATPVEAASLVLQFLCTVYLVAAILGDRRMTLALSLRRGWAMIPDLLVLTTAAFLPATKLHSLAHHVAVGKSPAMVWMLMSADALVVGFMASLVGSALYVAYSAANDGSRSEGGGPLRARRHP